MPSVIATQMQKVKPQDHRKPKIDLEVWLNSSLPFGTMYMYIIIL